MINESKSNCFAIEMISFKFTRKKKVIHYIILVHIFIDEHLKN